MTHFITISQDDKFAKPIITQNMNYQEEWILPWLKQGFDITITRPGPQPWHNKSWKVAHERRNLPVS